MNSNASNNFDRKSFAKARAEALKAIRKNRNLSSTARLVAEHIAQEYLSPTRLSAWPSYATVAMALGTSPKTIQRAIDALESAGQLRVERQPGRCNRLSFPMIEAASLTDFPANPLSGQICPRDRTELSQGSRQNCPPNLTKEPDKKPRQSSGLSFPRYVVPIGSDEAACWEKALRRQGIASLESYDLVDEEDGVAVFILPARWPPADDDAFAWRRMKIYFEDRIRRPQTKPIVGECPSCE